MGRLAMLILSGFWYLKRTRKHQLGKNEFVPAEINTNFVFPVLKWEPLNSCNSNGRSLNYKNMTGKLAQFFTLSLFISVSCCSCRSLNLMTFKSVIQCYCFLSCVWPVYEQGHTLRMLQLVHVLVTLESCAASVWYWWETCHVTCH